MNESTLTSALMHKLREQLRGYECFRHPASYLSQAGIPDVSITGYGRTTWLEVKFAKPSIRSRGIQDQTMLRLAGAGRAYYIIYHLEHDIKRMGIVHPRIVHDSDTNLWKYTGEWTLGFKHAMVADFIRRGHET